MQNGSTKKTTAINRSTTFWNIGMNGLAMSAEIVGTKGNGAHEPYVYKNIPITLVPNSPIRNLQKASSSHSTTWLSSISHKNELSISLARHKPRLSGYRHPTHHQIGSATATARKIWKR